MYRRDISSVIRFFGIFLALFVLYQVWIKPSYFPPPTSQPDQPLESRPLIDELSFPLENPTLLEPPQTRLINPGDAPSAKLKQLRNDLDRGDYHTVEAGLKKLSPNLLVAQHEKQFAAALWNNLGVHQEKFSGSMVSVKAFKQAVALAPKNPIALLNLTQAYWELRDEALTPEFLESVIRVAPHDAFAHMALADILIEKGNMAEATRHLDLAQGRAKADPYLGAYFQRLTGRLSRPAVASRNHTAPAATPLTAPSSTQPAPPETGAQPSPLVRQEPSTAPVVPTQSGETTDGSLKSGPGERFTFTFDGKSDPETAMRIRSILNYAHEEISKKFGYTPTAAFPVVLHTNQKFATDGGSPFEADKLYDINTFTIHLPVDGAMEDLAILSRVLRHQFAHAFLHDKMRGHIDQVPTWLVEGLAIQLAEDPWPALEEIKHKSAFTIPLSSLEKGWDRTQRDKLELAYLESATAVQSLLDRFGMYGIRQIMNLLQAGQSLEGAMKQKWSLSYEQFQKEWAQSVAASAK